MQQWDYEKNSDIDVNSVTIGSHIIANWICKQCGHKWKQTPYNRAMRKSGCPVCANKVIIAGVNDLKTLRPELMQEWNYAKNSTIFPEELSVGTNKKVWWKCKKGHEWEASVSNRSKKRNTGCPICDSERKTSMPEKVILYYLKLYFNDLVESYKPVFFKRGELDIFIPSISFAIEYDGERFHQNINRDIQKSNLCEKNGIKLLRVREPNCPMLPDTIKTYIRTSIYEDTLNEMIQDIILTSTTG